MKLEDYMDCEGCYYEIVECFKYQELGYDAGLDFSDKHCSFFVIDKKTGKLLIC